MNPKLYETQRLINFTIGGLTKVGGAAVVSAISGKMLREGIEIFGSVVKTQAQNVRDSFRK